LHSVHTGEFIEPSKLTLAEYLDRWLQDGARSTVSGKTFERYRQIVTDHITPTLGRTPLSKLQPLHIQGLYSNKLLTGRKDGAGGLSTQTVVHMHRILRRALGQAVKWQILVRNPVDAVEPPRVARKEMQALDEAETAKLLIAFERSSLRLPVLIAVLTGLRRGELLALRWADIDLETGQLSVKQSLEQTKAGLAFKQPKTSRSRRTLALPQLGIDALKKHKATQAAHRLNLGPVYQYHGLVFPREDGRPWKPDRFSSAFAAQVRRSGAAHVRLHDLQHTHATHLLRQGVNPKVVSERLGHSTVAFTLDVYSHVLPGMQDDAARRIDAALRLAIGKTEA
jgi:integrase